MSPQPQTLSTAFLEEVERLLTQLESGVLQLEQAPADHGLLNDIVRSAHTLKGSARLLNATAVHTLACQLEETLHRVRKRESLLSPEVIDTILRLCDRVREETHTFAHAAPPSPEPTTVPSAPADAAPPPVQPESEPEEEYLRVPLVRINALLRLIGELVMHNVQSTHTMTTVRGLVKEARVVEKLYVDMHAQLNGEAASAVSKGLRQPLQKIEARLQSLRQALTGHGAQMQEHSGRRDSIVDALQQKMKELRMLPCSTVFEGCGRTVRDIAREQGKQVHLHIDGATTELDKKVLEMLRGPLLHLVRNAVDHGIEPPAERDRLGKARAGTVTLRARAAGDRVIVEVRDDGRGVDRTAVQRAALEHGVITAGDLASLDEQQTLKLMFAPGVSTTASPSDISGRGVGLDVVQTTLHQLRGEVRVHSQPGQGTTVELVLPLTIALRRVLLVEVQRTTWAVPLLSVEETLPILSNHAGTPPVQIVLRGQTVPMWSLAALMHMPDLPLRKGVLLVLTVGHQRMGVMVDRVCGEEDVFVQRLGAHVGGIHGVQGGALLAAGQVAVVLDLHDVLAHAGVLATLVPSAVLPKRVLIVDDSAVIRTWEEQVLVAAGYAVETATDGQDALYHIQRHSFDVIVTDIQMPRMDGIALHEQLRAQPPTMATPVIFVTALAEAEMARRMRNIRRPCVLKKERLDPRTLLAMIERVTRGEDQ